MNNWKCSSS